MKKHSKVSLGILVLIITCICGILALDYYEQKSMSNPCHGGRDTVVELGRDCSIAILSGYNTIQEERTWTLYERGETGRGTIDNMITSYYIEGDYLYSIGSKGYTIINYEKNEIECYDSLNDLNDSYHKKIFGELSQKLVGNHVE